LSRERESKFEADSLSVRGPTLAVRCVVIRRTVLILSTPVMGSARGAAAPLEEDEQLASKTHRADFAGDGKVWRKDFEVCALLMRALVLGMALAGVTGCRQAGAMAS
jgi:hypothetical protein